MPSTILGEHALTLPAGTTAQRPASPTVGMHRFNTTTGTAEYYTGTAWVTFGFAGSPTSVNYAVVSGGGGGGSEYSGGGGAGGVVTGSVGVSKGTAYSIVPLV